MKNSKRSSSIFLALFAFLCGCQSTHGFEIKTSERKELYVVEIDRNRIIQECYFMNAEKENNWRHQYILYMLNEQNEVIPVYFPTNQGKEECLDHFKQVKKILQKGTRYKLCVRGRLQKMTEKFEPETHDFGPLGKHESPYYALTFDTICNSKDCYSISDTWTYTCPKEEFR